MGDAKKPKPLLHRAALNKDTFANAISIATCGARRDGGAKFTTNSRQVTYPKCLTKIREQQAAARARFEALGLG